MGSRSRSDATITIALNLYNSQVVLPSLSVALLELIHDLQPHHKIYISIFEHGSSDETVPMLSKLAAALVALNPNGIFIRHSYLLTSLTMTTDRILRLAQIRNEALLPLLPYASRGDSILLFINDIVTCSSDLLELAHQLLLQHANGVFATDWSGNGDFPASKAHFYDTWVARGINGDLPYPWIGNHGYHPTSPNGNWYTDLFATQDEVVHQRWLEGRPLPVYPGWNGAVTLRADLFTKSRVRFRASNQTGWSLGMHGEWGSLIGTPGFIESVCAASECKLFARDIWNLMQGKARFVLAPQARMTYELEIWEEIQGKVPPVRRTGTDEVGEGERDEELIDWSGVSVPEEVECAPAWRGGHENVRVKLSKSVMSVVFLTNEWLD